MTASTSPLKEQAEIAELEAKAALHKAEAGHYKLEQDLRKAEIRRTLAEAEQQEQQAIVAGIVRNERERVEELALNQDYYKYHFLFDGPVTDKTVSPLLNTMAAWHRRDADANWTITINSPGGSAIDGLHLFDEVYGYSRRGGGDHHITMKVRGMAASMAGILLQSADARLMGKNAWVLIHEVSSGAIGKIGELKDEVRFLERMCNNIADIFVERGSGITRAEFDDKWGRHDWWLSSDEMLELGFADAIG